MNGRIDYVGRVQHIARAFDNQVALVEQLGERIGQQIAAWKLGQVARSATRQYARDPHIGSMLEGHDQTTADEAGAGDTYSENFRTRL